MLMSYLVNTDKIDAATEFTITPAINTIKECGSVKIYRNVPEEYEILQTGVLLVKDKATDLELKVVYDENSGTYVATESGVTMGITNQKRNATYTANIRGAENGFTACGYIVVQDDAGHVLVKYTDTVRTSYEELLAADNG